MDTKQLDQLINDNLPRARAIAENESYYKGRHPPINSTPRKEAPDYRVSIPLLKVAVDQLAGYVAKPGSVQYIGDEYDTYLKPIYDANEETLITQWAFKQACINDSAFEIHWMQDGKDNFAIVPAGQGIPVYSNSLKPVMLEFVWVRTVDGKETATVYDAEYVTTYVKNDKEFNLIDEEPHGYGKVPVVEFNIDINKCNLFDHAKEIVDAHDRLYSHDIANELEKLANAYLLIRDRISQEDIDSLKLNAVFQGLGDNAASAVSFLTKNINTDFLEFSATNLLDMFYAAMQIPNPNDVKSSTPASGYAMMLRNMSFEFMCASIEGVFTRGLQDRIRLILGHSLIGVQANEITIKMNRNSPFDLESMARVSAQLTGILDIEAILDLFPPSLLSDEAKARILAGAESAKALSMEAFAQQSSAVDDQDEDDNQDDTIA